jgi:hypothetical protein
MFCISLDCGIGESRSNLESGSAQPSLFSISVTSTSETLGISNLKEIYFLLFMTSIFQWRLYSLGMAPRQILSMYCRGDGQLILATVLGIWGMTDKQTDKHTEVHKEVAPI